MTTIDHRILIPAAPDVVWNYVSDITHNPDWQVDCTDVIFLTSRREGPGLRWRYASPGGHEMVIAVTAWYNGLGYEYYFVDGTAFRENKGRIRLQEIPEGTIVQWTFTYELGGMLGGVRNSLGLRKQIDQTISESLKTLWQKIKQLTGASRVLEPKSLMREAPDVEARSTYQPRHPSVVDAAEAPENGKPLRLSPTPLKTEPPISDDDAFSFPVIEEPPIADDDTRKRSPFAAPTEPATPAVQAEPDFLNEMADDDLARFEPPRTSIPPATEPDFVSDIKAAELEAVDLARFEPPRDPEDTPPRPLRAVEPASEPQTSSDYTEAVVETRSTGEETEPLPSQPEIGPALSADAEQVAAIELNEQVTTPSPILDFDEETKLDLDDEATIQLEEFTPPAEEKTAEPDAPSAKPSEAHSPNASIWEIFGVQRPSETQEMRQLEQTTTPAETQPATPLQSVSEAAETVPSPAVDASAEETPLPALRRAVTTLEVEPIPSRLGLRMIQRRKSVHLRRL